MIVKKLLSEHYYFYEINTAQSLQGFRSFERVSKKTTLPKRKDDATFIDEKDDLEFSFNRSDNSISIEKELFSDEHIVGLGEKAFDLDRRRLSLKMWNTDTFGYQWHSDPLYVSIPFFISVRRGKAKGFFVDSTAKLLFDLGVTKYDKISISVPFDSVTLYVIKGPKIEQIIETYTKLTGLPLEIPEWALGHQVSRYSYYPQKNVIEIAREYRKHDLPVSAIYLDIDYMEDKKIFTWDREKFPNPKKMIDELHSMGIRVVAILDPGIKMDQNFTVFKDGLGNYCERTNGDLYCGTVWPGACVFPDFLSRKAQAFWSRWVSKFVSESGLDGIWLDMNEPSVFNESKTFEDGVVHRKDDEGAKLSHDLIHNVYAYFQAQATFEALSSTKKKQENGEAPFILTRAGCAGIQKFAAVWSGDNTSSWSNLRLQIPLLLGLSISGVPFVGCDIGGFIGNCSPELLMRYYQMAAFFPIFRNHKSKQGNDQEPYRLGSKYLEKIKKAISLRYLFMPYLLSLASEAHRFGYPIIRPLFYEYQEDEETYSINDQYMVGKDLLYAPILERGKQERELYLPNGMWIEWTNRKRSFEGNRWITTESEMPLYQRLGTVIPATGSAV